MLPLLFITFAIFIVIGLVFAVRDKIAVTGTNWTLQDAKRGRAVRNLALLFSGVVIIVMMLVFMNAGSTSQPTSVDVIGSQSPSVDVTGSWSPATPTPSGRKVKIRHYD